MFRPNGEEDRRGGRGCQTQGPRKSDEKQEDVRGADDCREDPASELGPAEYRVARR